MQKAMMRGVFGASILLTGLFVSATASAADQSQWAAATAGVPRVVATPAAVSDSAVDVKKRPVVGRVKANGAMRRPMDGKIAAVANANGVPPKLAVAIIRIESNYNPRAANGGALGLMQIKPRTAVSVGFHGGAGALFDADVNLRYGMRYLAQAYRAAHGDTCGTVMRYQSGLYASYFSGANRAYCARARSIMASL